MVYNKAMKKIIIHLKTILILLMVVCALTLIFIKNIGNTDKAYFLMDTYVTLNIKGINSQKAANEIYTRLKEIEAKMNSHSETSHVTQKLFDDELLYVLKKGIYYGDISNGLFDVTIKPLTRLWNVTAENPVVPSEEEILSAKKNINYKLIDITDNNVSVPESFEIDLGGIAKGYAADEAAKILTKHKIKNAIVNLGGNVYAFGTKKIGIQDPTSANGDYMGILTVTDCSVATSGGYERFFENDGKTYHHIIDPFTGFPSESDLLSATVVSSSSIDADCLATILFMSGTENATKLANKLGANYILIDKNKKVYCSDNVILKITNDKYTEVK